MFAFSQIFPVTGLLLIMLLGNNSNAQFPNVIWRSCQSDSCKTISLNNPESNVSGNRYYAKHPYRNREFNLELRILEANKFHLYRWVKSDAIAFIRSSGIIDSTNSFVFHGPSHTLGTNGDTLERSFRVNGRLEGLRIEHFCYPNNCYSIHSNYEYHHLNGPYQIFRNDSLIIWGQFQNHKYSGTWKLYKDSVRYAEGVYGNIMYKDSVYPEYQIFDGQTIYSRPIRIGQWRFYNPVDRKLERVEYYSSDGKLEKVEYIRDYKRRPSYPEYIHPQWIP